jgi:hypothetical protein
VEFQKSVSVQSAAINSQALSACMTDGPPGDGSVVKVDAGQRPGRSTEDSAEIKRLKREVAELRRAN